MNGLIVRKLCEGKKGHVSLLDCKDEFQEFFHSRFTTIAYDSRHT